MSRLELYDITVDNTLLLVIDIQERLLPAIHEGRELIDKAVRMIEAAKLFDLPILYTLQYPRGLGENVPEVNEALPQSAIRVEKTLFSGYEDVKGELAKLGRKNVVLMGTETHVCVFQTARDLLKAGYHVIAVLDGCSSRTPENRKNGFDMMKDMGATVINYESLLFDLLKDAKNPHFKQISNLVK